MSKQKTKFKVAGIGEILWDMLPGGKKLGGAPANFAYHAKMLGAESFAISSVGDDSLGKEIVDQLMQNQLSSEYIQVSHLYPTGEVKLDDQGKPDFTIHKDVAWDYISFPPHVAELARSLDAVCFGSLAQRSEVSRYSIRQMLEATPGQCLRIFDINMRQDYFNYEIIDNSLRLANCFKLNEDEFPVVAEIFSIDGDEESILNKLIKKFDLKIIALTKGSEGSILHTKNESSFLKSEKVEAIDTVGAGDSFTAAMGMGLLRELPLKIIHEQAIKLSAYVCTQKGAMPDIPENMNHEFK
jgi:fructokinase